MERANVERAFGDQAAQLAALQAQLASAKVSYETETQILNNLRERYAAQTADIQKTKQELIHAESDLSAVRVEKAEIEGAVLRDKEEVRDLQRQMTEVGSQTEMIKVDVEKAKKEAKQQKGLLAIAKKQLSTREAERAKEEKRLEEARAEAEASTREREEADAELAKEPTPILPLTTNGDQSPASSNPDILKLATAQPLPASPVLNSTPTVSPTTKSTNPFERLARASSMDRAESPFLPFATSVLPTPPGGTNDVPTFTSDTDAALLEDPFGFSSTFDADTPAPAKIVTDDTASEEDEEHGPPPGLGVPPPDIMSPAETEFLTPPSSAVGVQNSSTKKDDIVEVAATQFPALDATTAQFPEVSPQVPGHFPEEPEETHLDSQLKEIELDESDSDDDEPLTTVKAKLAESHSPAPTNGIGASAPSSSAFDDTFGITSAPAGSLKEEQPSATPVIEKSASGAPATSVRDLFADPSAPPVQPPTTSISTDTVKQNGVAAISDAPAGVSDFDEALGKIPSTSGAPSQFTDFSFDTAFDDNFDFAAATAATKGTESSPLPNGGATNSFPPAPSASGATSDSFDAVFLAGTGGSSPAPPAVLPNVAPSPTVAQVPAPAAQEAKAFSFDDVFGTPATQQPPQAPNTQLTGQIPQLNLPASQPSTSNGGPSISFDDAFGGVSPSEALALDNAFTSPTFQPPPGPPPQQTATPFPTSSQPSSPRAAEGLVTLGPQRSYTPPLRQASPPPRHSSPRPRPSTGSTDKEKPPARHSKLSVSCPTNQFAKSSMKLTRL